MHVDDLDYELPEALIAREPCEQRDASRLMEVNPHLNAVTHRHIRDLPMMLPTSVIIVNDTQVITARLFATGAKGQDIECLFIEPYLIESLARADSLPPIQESWLVMVKGAKKIAIGDSLQFTAANHHKAAHVIARNEHNWLVLGFESKGDVDELINTQGHMPLPPYMRRQAKANDKQRYQTIFAQHPGAVAAPTAGLHFTPALVDALEKQGHRIVPITLHVGPGTFLPVRTATLEEHAMHVERYRIPESTAATIRKARKQGIPILAVGTTVVRALESAADEYGSLIKLEGSTDLLIAPGYTFRVVDSLLTNFHLPRSTLIALVMAFAGIDLIHDAYREAIQHRYRFYSYGDAMLLSSRMS